MKHDRGRDILKSSPSSMTSLTDTGTTSLTDLPLAWLMQLRNELSGPEVLALFQTCRGTRDLIRHQRTLKLCFRLPIPLNKAAAAQAKLLLALKHSSSIKLWFIPDYTEHTDRLAATEASASSLMWRAKAALGGGLDAITSVELDDLELNAVVPSWLAYTCPNISSLKHAHCRFTLPATTASLTGCQHLTHLTLHGVGKALDQSQLPRWQHQLRALTGLTSLEVASSEPCFLECCSVLGSQLTQLSCKMITPAVSLAQLPGWYPHLTVLRLPDTVIDDQGMEALLSMQLQRLTCSGFQLQHSYTHRTCTWRHLAFSRLNVAAFDRLPLARVQSMAGVAGLMTVVPSPGGDLGASSRVAAAVARCGGITTYSLTLDNSGDNHADSASVAAAMAVVANCRTTTFQVKHVRPVTAGLLEAFSQHLPSTKAADVTFIMHHAKDTFSADALPLVLPSLPCSVERVAVLLDRWCPEAVLTEEQATTVCVHACRPVRVEVALAGQYWQTRWHLRLQAAMAAAGHQHVRFQG